MTRRSLLALLAGTPVALAASSPMPGWECLHFPAHSYSFDQAIAVLSGLQASGWEVLSFPEGSGLQFFPVHDRAGRLLAERRAFVRRKQ